MLQEVAKHQKKTGMSMWWVKNYYGEVESGYYNWQAMTSLIWIDQELKAELGY